jgi:broad specificity phosphatase PhoE
LTQMTLYLVRHGESISNSKNIFIGRSVDPALTVKGIQQATSLAKSLKQKDIKAVFSSTLLRASQTAQIVADDIKLPVTYSEDLIEVGLGVLDGHDINNPAYLSVYENLVSNWQSGYPFVKIPEGESLQDVKARLERFLQASIFSNHFDGPVLIVGHAILWMCFIWAFCDNHPDRINDGFMKKTHLSIISGMKNRFSLEKLNLDHKEVLILK